LRGTTTSKFTIESIFRLLRFGSSLHFMDSEGLPVSHDINTHAGTKTFGVFRGDPAVIGSKLIRPSCPRHCFRFEAPFRGKSREYSVDEPMNKVLAMWVMITMWVMIIINSIFDEFKIIIEING
jgi:hypothetical protein